MRVRARDKKTGRPAGQTTVTFKAGRTTAKASIPTTRDGKDGPTRRLDLRLARASGLRADTTAHRVLVRDRDPAPRVDGVDRTATEPTGAATTVPVRFRLDKASLRKVTLVVETRPGTTGAGDVRPLRRRVVVPAGTRRFEVAVTLLPDRAEEGPEEAETFTVEVTNARYARIGRPATVTVRPAPTP